MKRLLNLLPSLLGIILLILSVGIIRQELRAYSFQDIWQSLTIIPTDRLLGAMGLTVLGYLSMTGYDWLGFRYIRRTLSLPKIVLTAFVSYAVSNNIGLTLFSGTAVRYRFYASYGIDLLDIAKIIVFIHFSFWLGICGIGGLVFLIDPLTLPTVLDLPFQSVHLLGGILFAIAISFFTLSLAWKKTLIFRGKTLTLPNGQLSVGLMLFSALDWAFASGVLYLLLPDQTAISYFSFFGIYILALTAGIISNVPGGLGVFETVILLVCSPKIPKPDILGALLAYRGIYYFLPLITAAMLWLVYESQQRKQ
jgi:uncharacterized membrane protein YbhN (UPF0104 family)